jgi:hypothetical protein
MSSNRGVKSSRIYLPCTFSQIERNLRMAMVPQTQVKNLPPQIRRQNGKRLVVETTMPPACSFVLLFNFAYRLHDEAFPGNQSCQFGVCVQRFRDCLCVHHQRWTWGLPYSHATCIQMVSSLLLQCVLQTSGTNSILTWQIARENFTVNFQDSGQERNFSTVLFQFTLLYVLLRSLWIGSTWLQISSKTRVCKLHSLHHHYLDTETWNYKLQIYIYSSSHAIWWCLLGRIGNRLYQSMGKELLCQSYRLPHVWTRIDYLSVLTEP